MIPEPARDWLVPLLGLPDEHEGGKLSIEHSIYMWGQAISLRSGPHLP